MISLATLVPAIPPFDQIKESLSGGAAKVIEVATDFLSQGPIKIVTTLLGWMIQGVGEFLGTIFKAAGAMFAASSGIRPGDAAADEATQLVMDSTWLISFLILVVTLAIGSAKMAITHKDEDARAIFKGLGYYALMSVAWYAAVKLAILSTDALSKWIWVEMFADKFSATLPATFGTIFTVMAAGETFALTTPLAIIFMILFALLASLGAVIQIIILVGRSALLVIFAGLGPVAASGAITETGRGWIRKIIAWTVAFIIYKPVGTLLYAIALKIYNNMVPTLSELNLITDFFDLLPLLLTPIAIMLMAIFALPALIKLITPALDQSGSGGGAGAAIVGALATGAITISAMKNSANSSSNKDSGGGASGASITTGGTGGAGSGGTVPSGGGAGAGASAGAGGASAASAGAGAATGGASIIAEKGIEMVGEGIKLAKGAAEDTAEGN